MGRRVENPFKEQGLPSWIRYLSTGLTGFFVAWCLFGGKRDSAIDRKLTSTSQALKSRLRRAQPEVEEKYVQEYENDDFIEPEETPAPNDEEGGDDFFPDLPQDEYLEWVHSHYETLKFNPQKARNLLTKPMLEESLDLGCDYLAANQKEGTGNFNYQYDFVEKKLDTDDSPVRQAGALWGMTLCFQSHPQNESYRSSVELGIAFFQDHMVAGPVPGSSMIEYPDFEESQSGVNALYGLTLIDYIRTIRDNDLPLTDDTDDQYSIRNLEEQLAKTIGFLRYMQNSNLHFSETYDFEDEQKSRESSPYYDGETLLCLVKAARYIDGYEDSLIPVIEKVAPVLAKSYTLDAWRDDEYDSDSTKGFYQWSSMAFTEYFFAQWKDYEYFGDLVLSLSHWIVHIHGILERPKNTGYAFEGIISALHIAQNRQEKEIVGDLLYTIHEGLYNLGT